jgi:UDPglucose 6-dehydrogenase
VDEVNDEQKSVLFRKIQRHFGSELSGKTFAVWGLAFKPRTDDIREAPALVLIDELLNAGAAVRTHDPEAMDNVKAIYGNRITFCDRPYGALEGADALALVTEWQEFRTPDFELMKRLLSTPLIFDGRNVYDERTMDQNGFTYYGIGRGRRIG